jgi:hypothetical protein
VAVTVYENSPGDDVRRIPDPFDDVPSLQVAIPGPSRSAHEYVVVTLWPTL